MLPPYKTTKGMIMLRKKMLVALMALTVMTPAAFAEEKAKEPAAAPAAEAPATGADAPVPAEKAEVETTEGRMLLNQKLPNDIVFGDENAKITLTEYASLSCSHCRDFYMTVFGKLKENYIDTGKVRFIYRHYPLNINALRGAQLLQCGVTDAEKQKVFLGAMFQSQPEWAYKEDEKDIIAKLKSIAKIGGIDDSKFEACAKDKKLEDELLRQQLLTQKALGVSATPTLYIGTKKYFDKKDYETVAKAVDNALANIGKEEEPAAEEKKAE